MFQAHENYKPQFKTEFQRYHVEEPALRPYLLKTVHCFVVDRNDEPVMLKRRQGERVQRQATRRYFFEVARLGCRWCFVEWSADGAVVDRKITAKLSEAIEMYEREPDVVVNLDLPEQGDGG